MTSAPQKSGPGRPRLSTGEQTIAVLVRFPASTVKAIDEHPGKSRAEKVRAMVAKALG